MPRAAGAPAPQSDHFVLCLPSIWSTTSLQIPAKFGECSLCRLEGSYMAANAYCKAHSMNQKKAVVDATG